MDGEGILVHVPAGRIYSLLQTLQTSSGAHRAFCSVGTDVSSQGSSGWGMTLTAHLNLEIWQEQHYTSTLIYAFMAWTGILLKMESAWMGEYCNIITSTLKLESAGHQHSSLPYRAKTFFIPC